MRRKIGLKALEQGANAVIGYKQLFDLEGESGIVVRVGVFALFYSMLNRFGSVIQTFDLLAIRSLGVYL